MLATAHTPEVPSAFAHTSVFFEVLAMQQAPVATGRPALTTRARIAVASSLAGRASVVAAKKVTRSDENCILDD